MRTILAQLVVALRDNASAPAKAVSQALRGVTASANELGRTRASGDLKRGLDDARRSAQDLARSMSGVGWGDAWQNRLNKLRVSASEMRTLRREWAELQRELANPVGGRIASGVMGVTSSWKKQKLNEIVAVRAEMHRLREEWNQPLSLMRRGGRFAEKQRAGAMPALRLIQHRGNLPLRLHTLQGALALQGVPRTFRSIQMPLMTLHAPPRAGELSSAQRETEGGVANAPLPLAARGTSPARGGGS